MALLFAFLYRAKTSDEEQVTSDVGTAPINAKLKTRSLKRASVFPWFILLFLAATVIRTYAPVTIEPSVYDALVNLAKAGMIVTLFLIGASLSRETLKKVGIAPLIQGVILWIVISVVSLFAVLKIL